jgi:TolB-like protein
LNFIHVTCYRASLYVVDFKCAPNFDEARAKITIRRAQDSTSRLPRSVDSLAVLPLVNATGNPETEYLSDGISESIINLLSQLPNLRVIPRTSAFRYKGLRDGPHLRAAVRQRRASQNSFIAAGKSSFNRSGVSKG